MSTDIAFLDSCVLYPFSLRDLLIEFAVNGLYQAKWSAQIRRQVIRNVEANNPLTQGKLNRTFDLMEKAILDFEAEPTQALLEFVSTSTTKPEDQEILAAAISNGCTHLVTANLKDFDIGFGLANGVAVVHPDEFLKNIIIGDKTIAAAALENVIRRWKKPPVTKAEYLMALKSNRLSKTVELLSNL